MLVAYTVIIGGGLLITRRLRLLALAATFWVTLAIGRRDAGRVRPLHDRATGRSRRSAASTSGGSSSTSPEVLIFLFFMITDPKTVARPAGSDGSSFGFLVAVASTLLMAPQTDEFGTKVGLLAGLVVDVRGPARARPARARAAVGGGRIGRFARRVAVGGRADRAPARVAAGSVSWRSRRPGLGAGIVAAGHAGARARRRRHGRAAWRGARRVDPATLPGDHRRRGRRRLRPRARRPRDAAGSS